MIRGKLTLPKMVEEVLSKYPHSRDNDLYLWAQVASDYYPLPERKPETWYEVAMLLQNTPRLDQIATIRRRIIAKYKNKKYLPTTKELAVFRGFSVRAWNKYARENPDEVELPQPPASNYPSHYTPEQIAEMDI